VDPVGREPKELPYFVSTKVTEAARYFFDLKPEPGTNLEVVFGLKVAKPEISAKDGSPRKRVRPLSVHSEDPEVAFVHAAQTRVGANSPLPNGWFLLGR
jgi:hypothetical protein